MRWMMLARYARHLPTGSTFPPNILPLVYPKKPDLVGVLRLLIGFTSRRAVGRMHGGRVFRVARIYHKRLFGRLEYPCGTPTGSRVPTLLETLSGQRVRLATLAACLRAPHSLHLAAWSVLRPCVQRRRSPVCFRRFARLHLVQRHALRFFVSFVCWSE